MSGLAKKKRSRQRRRIERQPLYQLGKRMATRREQEVLATIIQPAAESPMIIDRMSSVHDFLSVGATKNFKSASGRLVQKTYNEDGSIRRITIDNALIHDGQTIEQEIEAMGNSA